MIERLDKIEEKYEEIKEKLTTEEVLNNISLLTELSKEQGSIEEIVKKYRNYKNVLKSIEDDKELIKDPELNSRRRVKTVRTRKRKDYS